MSVHVECPICRLKQSLRNKRCSCGKDLDKAKKAGAVKYWIHYRVPIEQAGGSVERRQRWELIGRSLEEARDADGKRRGQRRENRVFEILPSGQMTFGELADWYLKLDVIKAVKYYESLGYYLVHFLAEFSGRTVSAIKTVDLENYQAKRKAAGDSDAYIDHQVGTAKTVIYKAHENDLVGPRVYLAFKKVRKMLRKGANARKKLLSPAQFIGLMAHLPVHAKRILATGFYTGMRKGEILNLVWPKVNLDERYVELEASDTKDSEARTVPIGDELHKVLEAIPRDQRDKHVFLFRGKPVRDIRTGLKKACLLAGIPYGRKAKGGFVFHDLRHSFNTYARKAGIAESVIMDITGHATREMFDWYNTVDLDDLRRAQARFEKFVKSEIQRTVAKDKVIHSVIHAGEKG